MSPRLVLGSDEDRDWEQLLGDLVGDLRPLGMRPMVCIDERSREAATAQADVQRAA
jgi:hypothetical protein